MALEYTEEQLNSFDKKTLVQLFLVQQSQAERDRYEVAASVRTGCSIEPKTFWKIIGKT